MAPVEKRLTISDAGSTSSMGTRGCMGRNSNRPRSVPSSRVWSSICFAYSRKRS